MKIDSSTISMFSRHEAARNYEKKESLKAWIGDKRPDFEGRGGAERVSAQLPTPIKDVANISVEAQAAQKTKKPDGENIEISDKDAIKILLVERLLEMITGQKVKISIVKLPTGGEDAVDLKAADTQAAPQKAGWGVEYDSHEAYMEQEKTSFSVEGVVKTSDGNEIKFNIQLAMNREFRAEANVSLRAGDAKKVDPLVINFDGTAAQLTDTKFQFDLNADGQVDSVSFLRGGSGFLALDKNSDGVVNNGRELFGPRSGNGFSELAAYDENSDGWIDETDKIYSSLRIWTRDSAGINVLDTLADKGVGAINLASLSTPFDIKNAENVQHGTVAASGIYLRENGSAGTIQQVDLAV